MLEVAQSERDAIVASADLAIRTVAKHHDFLLPITQPAEGNRLIGFLETLRQGDYEEFKGWPSIMFTAAVGTARIIVLEQMQRK